MIISYVMNVKNIIDISRNDNSNNYIDGNLVIDYDVKYVGICKKMFREEGKKWN